MRREGRQHGWVYAFEYDPDLKRRPANAATAVTKPMANGGYIKVPRKPTNHSKFTSGSPCKEIDKGLGKRSQKFKYDEVKMYYRDATDECWNYQNDADDQ